MRGEWKISFFERLTVDKYFADAESAVRIIFWTCFLFATTTLQLLPVYFPTCSYLLFESVNHRWLSSSLPTVRWVHSSTNSIPTIDRNVAHGEKNDEWYFHCAQRQGSSLFVLPTITLPHTRYVRHCDRRSRCECNSWDVSNSHGTYDREAESKNTLSNENEVLRWRRLDTSITQWKPVHSCIFQRYFLLFLWLFDESKNWLISLECYSFRLFENLGKKVFDFDSARQNELNANPPSMIRIIRNRRKATCNQMMTDKLYVLNEEVFNHFTFL